MYVNSRLILAGFNPLLQGGMAEPPVRTRKRQGLASNTTVTQRRGRILQPHTLGCITAVSASVDGDGSCISLDRAATNLYHMMM
jgi:hypothetical protein